MADIDYSGGSNVNIIDGLSSGNKAEVTSDNALIIKQKRNVNKTPVWQRNTLTTTTTTADQVVGTYTVTNGSTICLGCVVMSGERTTPVNTNQILGTVNFQYTNNGSTWIDLISLTLRSGITGISTNRCVTKLHPDVIQLTGDGNRGFRMIVTPADTTSTDWQFVLIGNEYT